MAIAASLLTLAQWMAGEFSNQAQALDQPIWFVHLRLWQRPLPFLIDGNLALFAEQANVLQLDQPYRQRVVVLCSDATVGLQAYYLALKNPGQFRGAGANSQLLKALQIEDLEPLPGCRLQVEPQVDKFVAKMLPQTKCCFQYQGEIRQVELGFEACAERFFSCDRGIDPQTGQALWGALFAPYEFKKIQDFSQELLLSKFEH